MRYFILLIIVCFSFTLSAQYKLKFKPEYEDFSAEKITMTHKAFDLNFQLITVFGYENDTIIVVNKTLISTEPIQVEDFAYFLNHALDRDPEAIEIKEEWIPSQVNWRNGVASFNAEEGKDFVEVPIEAASRYCEWLTYFVNEIRLETGYFQLPNFRIPTTLEITTKESKYIRYKTPKIGNDLMGVMKYGYGIEGNKVFYENFNMNENELGSLVPEQGEVEFGKKTPINDDTKSNFYIAVSRVIQSGGYEF